MRMTTSGKLYVNQLQKQMDTDMEELLSYEARQYDAGDKRKVQPAFMLGDYFEEKKEESKMRALRRGEQYE